MKVYPSALEQHLWTFLALSEEAADYIWRGLDPQDEAAVRHIIGHTLVPDFVHSSGTRQRAIKDALQWSLNCQPDERLAEITGTPGFPFDFPQPARRFYEWLWSELFGDEDWRDPAWAGAEVAPHDERPPTEPEDGRWLRRFDPKVLHFRRKDGRPPGEGAPTDVHINTGARKPALPRRPTDAARFLRHEDQANALDQAVAVHAQTGQCKVWVRFDWVIGEGYLVGGQGKPRETDVAVVRFRDGNPVDSFPDLRRGWEFDPPGYGADTSTGM